MLDAIMLTSEDDCIDDISLFLQDDYSLTILARNTAIQIDLPKTVLPQLFDALWDYVHDESDPESIFPEGQHRQIYPQKVAAYYLSNTNRKLIQSLDQRLTTSYASIFEFNVSNVVVEEHTGMSADVSQALNTTTAGIWILQDEAWEIIPTSPKNFVL